MYGFLFNIMLVRFIYSVACDYRSFIFITLVPNKYLLNEDNEMIITKIQKRK